MDFGESTGWALKSSQAYNSTSHDPMTSIIACNCMSAGKQQNRQRHVTAQALRLPCATLWRGAPSFRPQRQALCSLPATQGCPWNGPEATSDGNLPPSSMCQESFPSGQKIGIKLKQIKIVRLCRMTGKTKQT